MYSKDFIYCCAVFGLIVFSASACRFWQNGGNATPSPTPFVAEELKSEIPFASKEPEIFQAEIVTIANETERRIFTARNGANRRTDYNFGSENQVTNLQIDKNYLIFPKGKIYAENAAAETFANEDDWTLFLTTEWLNDKKEARFEKLETVENLTKYRVLLDGKEVSEILIYFDETLKIPVRQEFYSVNGDQRSLNFTFEIRNLKLRTDENLFALTPDFRKVSIEELRKELNKND